MACRIHTGERDYFLGREYWVLLKGQRDPVMRASSESASHPIHAGVEWSHVE
jgi:hypothetical protein